MIPQEYDDVFIRDGLDDLGSIPYAGTFACVSPDIIPQPPQTTHPLSWFSDTWAQDPGQNVTGGTNSIVFLRGRNLKGIATTATAFLYAAPSSLLLNSNIWSQSPLSTASGSSFATLADVNGAASIGPNDICAHTDPFVLNLPVPTNFHYCMVARIVTPDHANPIPPPFQSNADFVTWVVQNPNVAWRNITVFAPTSGPISQAQSFANIDKTDESYWFMVSGKGFPEMTKVVIEGVTPGCTFSTTGFFGDPGGQQTVLAIQEIPAGFSGIVQVTATPPPLGTFPDGASVEIAFWREGKGGDPPELLMYGARADAIGIHPKVLFDTVGEDVPTVVKLGACTLLAAAVAGGAIE